VSRAEIMTVDVLTPQSIHWCHASLLVEEVRMQFNTITGLMEGTAKPNYATCEKISTDASIKKMTTP